MLLRVLFLVFVGANLLLFTGCGKERQPTNYANRTTLPNSYNKNGQPSGGGTQPQSYRPSGNSNPQNNWNNILPPPDYSPEPDSSPGAWPSDDSWW